jgi:hypothetical protein
VTLWNSFVGIEPLLIAHFSFNDWQKEQQVHFVCQEREKKGKKRKKKKDWHSFKVD